MKNALVFFIYIYLELKLKKMFVWQLILIVSLTAPTNAHDKSVMVCLRDIVYIRLVV